MNAPLDEYLARPYPYTVHPDADDGGVVIVFPDLPGCMTQVDSADEIAAAADEIRTLWIETAVARGHAVPPLPPDTGGANLVMRLPRTLHRTLSERARAEGVGLASWATILLALAAANARVDDPDGDASLPPREAPVAAPDPRSKRAAANADGGNVDGSTNVGEVEPIDAASLSDDALFAGWALLIREMRRRDLTRSGSNPVGDYAELLVARRLGLRLAQKSAEGYDAVADDGARYQIKARRQLGGIGDKELGAVKNIDQQDFDYLVAVLFDEDLGVAAMWRFPFELVREKAIYKKQVNGHVLYMRPSVLDDPRAERLA